MAGAIKHAERRPITPACQAYDLRVAEVEKDANDARPRSNSADSIHSLGLARIFLPILLIHARSYVSLFDSRD